MASRIKLDTSNKVDLSHLMQFQGQVGDVLTRDLNRLAYSSRWL